ncbi:hypothetical protein VNO77_18187 [Canavalia gladiata]|uniref:Uncharacterized protein n=1 Tax=Canavalia gladiata TaxID=3824 RepID=A0AAN9LKC8_CANGL
MDSTMDYLMLTSNRSTSNSLKSHNLFQETPHVPGDYDQLHHIEGSIQQDAVLSFKLAHSSANRREKGFSLGKIMGKRW